jgi:predicted metal-binding membrane protein
MALAFVGGMASLGWMGLATVLMVLEKLPRAGARLTRPLGWVLLAAAGLAAAGGLG